MRSVVLLAALVLAASSACLAQNGRGAPTGAEIAQKARAARFDVQRAGTGIVQGKPMKLTPAILTSGITLQDIKAGQVIGMLENGAAGDETGLPPGRYHLFLVSIGDQWQAYAEANGRVVATAIRTSMINGVAPTPQFVPNGWCINIGFGGFPVWRICF